MKVLFVCLGNICRSPTAEAVLRAQAEQAGIAIDIDSAGTAVYHIGKSPDARSMAAALKRDIHMQGLKARQVSEEDFHEFDYVFAMDKSNFADLSELQPESGKAELILFLDEYGSKERDEVPDPYYGGDLGFEWVLDLLESACSDFLTRIQK